MEVQDVNKWPALDWKVAGVVRFEARATALTDAFPLDKKPRTGYINSSSECSAAW
jgi:hypothetical protein